MRKLTKIFAPALIAAATLSISHRLGKRGLTAFLPALPAEDRKPVGAGADVHMRGGIHGKMNTPIAASRKVG